MTDQNTYRLIQIADLFNDHEIDLSSIEEAVRQTLNAMGKIRSEKGLAALRNE